MKIEKIIMELETHAPKELQDNWDNSGLQVGNTQIEAKKVLLTLDVTLEVIEYAKNIGANLIISHHPLIFKPIKSIAYDDYKGKLIIEAIKSDIVIYSAHTNIDCAKNGLNDYLAEAIGLKKFEVLEPIDLDIYKISVFIPVGMEDDFSKLLEKLGTGKIGNYIACSYETRGKGRFTPIEGSNPFIGSTGIQEIVNETKLEFITTKHELVKTVTEIKALHPYEEPAIDIVKLENKANIFGYGRVGNIEGKTLDEYANLLLDKLNLESLIMYGEKDKFIKRVAVCGGSGSDFIYSAKKSGADLYITGDIKYHDSQLAHELGLAILDITHYRSEYLYLYRLREQLLEKISNVEFEIYNKEHFIRTVISK